MAEGMSESRESCPTKSHSRCQKIAGGKQNISILGAGISYGVLLSLAKYEMKTNSFPSDGRVILRSEPAY